MRGSTLDHLEAMLGLCWVSKETHAQDPDNCYRNMTKIHPDTNSLVDSFKEEMQKESSC
jgi:hypothetical protein